MPDECDGLSVWGDLGIAIALSRKRVGRQAQAGKIRSVIPHEEDSVSAGTVDAFVNEVMSIGSEGRLGMNTCRSQIVKIGAIGIYDRDPPCVSSSNENAMRRPSGDQSGEYAEPFTFVS